MGKRDKEKWREKDEAKGAKRRKGNALAELQRR